MASKVNRKGSGTKRALISFPLWRRKFPVHGQGTVIFNITRDAPFSIIIKQRKRDKWIGVDVLSGSAQLVMKDDSEPYILTSTTDEHSGVDAGRKISYWLSYDRFHCSVIYGKGYRMEQTTILRHDFLENVKPEEEEEARKELEDYFNPTENKFIEFQDFDKTNTRAKKAAEDAPYDDTLSLIDMENRVDFDYNPFVSNFPPFVYTGSKIDMLTIENGQYLLPASLPEACQMLYTNIKDVEVNFLQEYDECLLTDAIRYSIVTPGCELNKKLEEKSMEFGSYNPSQTYLRVTLGNKYYNSPGVAYVLEIWPVGHYSPIHNHSNAYAVIKVLFGGLTVHLYNKHVLTDNSTEYDQREILAINVKAGDLTWLSPNWYATHKLKNDTDDFCATIQCYQFAQEDKQHWPYFDYLQEDGENFYTSGFLPGSDYTFRQLHDIVIDEYKNRLIPI